jgi:hypothetical protein
MEAPMQDSWLLSWLLSWFFLAPLSWLLLATPGSSSGAPWLLSWLLSPGSSILAPLSWLLYIYICTGSSPGAPLLLLAPLLAPRPWLFSWLLLWRPLAPLSWLSLAPPSSSLLAPGSSPGFSPGSSLLLAPPASFLARSWLLLALLSWLLTHTHCQSSLVVELASQTISHSASLSCAKPVPAGNWFCTRTRSSNSPKIEKHQNRLQKGPRGKTIST